MNQSNGKSAHVKNNIVRAKVTIRGARPLFLHAFGPDAIPLEKKEKEGVAGNEPGEWRRSMLVTSEGQLYVRNDYVFGCLRNGSVRTKKGRGSIQKDVEATLEIEPAVILIDRFLPEGEPTRDPTQDVYIDVRGVVNKNTKGRNVRYRLAAAAGWTCSFVLVWDKTVVSREQMRAVLKDSGTFGGIGDGIRIGMGRFEVVSYEEVGNVGGKADEEASPAEGTVAGAEEGSLGTRWRTLSAVPEGGDA